MSTLHHFKVYGMQCSGCENAIAEIIDQLDHVDFISADHYSGEVEICYDNDLIKLETIYRALQRQGYFHEPASDVKKPISLEKPEKKISWGWLWGLLLFLVLVAIMLLSRKVWHQFELPEISAQLTDGMVFLVGLITGLHCIGMCGAFVISYSDNVRKQKQSAYLAHFLYGTGKTVSYALFGAFFGYMGSLISITPFIQGLTILAAGLFLLLFGLKMLGVFSVLRGFHIGESESIKKFAANKRKQSKSPLLIGFFSGFILGCGPLQAMYVMAAASGDALTGAKTLALFGLGTLPALVSFGFITQLMSATMTRRFFQFSGLILIVIGTMMLNKGLLKTNSGMDIASLQKLVIHKYRLMHGSGQ